VTDVDPSPIDLDRIERDLAEVEAALERLDAGTYGIDAVSGTLIDDAVLAVDPLARTSRRPEPPTSAATPER